jgi:cellulose biosynthesis protein BcsQ
MNSSIYFDDSLPAFAALVCDEWGEKAISENFFLRDVTGRLTFIVLSEKYSIETRATLAKKASDTLGNYVDNNGFAIATPDELFDERLKDLTKARKIHLNSIVFSGAVYLVDRRMVGADWLRNPAPSASPPTRFVFASIKGGVGRSTALCVLAAHLATHGRRVLAIDMDLEAPGLGNMLLPDGTLPKFGLLDYLVEQSLGSLDDQFYADMIGASWLGGGRGRVDVLPAIGQRSLDNPANVLAKIARAYLGGGEQNCELDLNGEPPSFMDNMSILLDRISDPLRYDAILIDARAGLHETTAAAVVGLGAEVFFFGLNQPQTFAGYDLLLAHLATLPIDLNDDWRNRIKFIQAKVPESPVIREEFSQNMNTLFQKHFWPSSTSSDNQIDMTSLKDTFEVEWIEDTTLEKTPLLEDDKTIPTISILDDRRFSSFSPSTDRDSLLERIYSVTFGELLEIATEMVDDSIIKRPVS